MLYIILPANSLKLAQNQADKAQRTVKGTQSLPATSFQTSFTNNFSTDGLTSSLTIGGTPDPPPHFHRKHLHHLVVSYHLQTPHQTECLLYRIRQAVFLPTTTFDGKDKSLTRAHWQSFEDFIERQGLSKTTLSGDEMKEIC